MLNDWIGAESLQAPSSESKGIGATPWIAGGVIVLLAVAVYAIETKGPQPLRRA